MYYPTEKESQSNLFSCIFLFKKYFLAADQILNKMKIKEKLYLRTIFKVEIFYYKQVSDRGCIPPLLMNLMVYHSIQDNFFFFLLGNDDLNCSCKMKNARELELETFTKLSYKRSLSSSGHQLPDSSHAVTSN